MVSVACQFFFSLEAGFENSSLNPEFILAPVSAMSAPMEAWRYLKVDWVIRLTWVDGWMAIGWVCGLAVLALGKNRLRGDETGSGGA